MTGQETDVERVQVVRARPVALAIALAVVALAFGLVLLRWAPPQAQDRDAPSDVFSAGRAMAVLGDLLAEGQPHPVGSEINDRVRDRIVDRLEALGYQVEVQETISCRSRSGALGTCAPVENVMTRLPGQSDGPAVAIVAHYDAVAAGPGAADDTSSVAEMLEMARILKAEAPFPNPIIFLFTDGEEIGLMGAKAFVQEHPWVDDLGVVINLEARGSRGQSLLFETSDDNAWLIAAYAASVPRPSANSLSYEIYKQLPNDTDLTVFKEAGIPAMNFSFIEGSTHYHTALDTLQNLDARSVQHQGESVLALVRELAATDLTDPPPDNAVYLDLLGLFVIRWPAAWTLPLVLLGALLLIASVIQAIRRRWLTVGALGWGFLTALLCVILSIALGAGLILLIAALGDGPQPWYAHPLPTRLALWVGALLVGGLMAAGPGRRAGLWGLGLGAWLLWTVLALALTLTLTGAAIILWVPVLVATLLVAAAVFSGRGGVAPVREGVFIAAAVLPAIICLPYALMFEAATGFDMNAAITLMLGLFVATLLPLLALPRERARLRLVFTLASAVVVVLVIVAALLVPPYSEASPQPVNVYYAADADAGQARWVSEPADDVTPEPLRAQFSGDAVAVFPWYGAMYLTAPAEMTAAPPPSVEVLADELAGGERTVTLRLRSPRGANEIDLLVPIAQLASIAVEGHSMPVAVGDSWNEYYNLWCYGRACDGVEVTFHLAGSGPIELFVVDFSLGLPSGGERLLEARPATAVPYQLGDRTAIWRRVDL